jgi:hypothetical protein
MKDYQLNLSLTNYPKKSNKEIDDFYIINRNKSKLRNIKMKSLLPKIINQVYTEFLNVIWSLFIDNLILENKIINASLRSINLFVSDNLNLWKFLDVCEHKKAN